MTRRDRPRSQAAPTSRTRRLRGPSADEGLRLRDPEPGSGGPGGDDADDSEATRVTAPAARRRPRWRWIILGTLLVVLVGAIGGGVLLWQRVARFNDSVSSAPSTSFDLLGALNGTDRVNIALFGYGGAEHKGGNYLADSIQILSIDPQANTTSLIPIPRDFWVEGLPEIPDNGKINEAFAIGQLRGGIDEAGRFTAGVLSQVTGLTIEYWMAIDFSGFRDVIDAVGGVTITNPRPFKYTWSEASYHAGRFNAGSFKRGQLTLNGEQALTYARARYTSDPRESSDFARSVRQQRVLQALRAKVGAGGIGSIGPGLGLMDALAGKMRTNLSAIDLFLLSGHLHIDRRLELKEGVVLEATTNTIGQYILIPRGQESSTDYRPVQSWLRRQLARPIPTPSPSVEPSP
jgi:LCP family protein required for cell wall assembly